MRIASASVLVLTLVVACVPAAAPPQPINPAQRQRIASALRASDETLAAGRFDRAVQHQQEMVDCLRLWLGDKHLKTWTARRDLERIQHLAKLPRDDWPRAARVLEKGTRAARARGKDADRLQREALAACRQTFGKQHYETIIASINRADFLTEQGRYPEAAALLDTVIKIAIKSLGEKHVLVGTCHFALGLNALQQGTDLKAAEAHFDASSKNFRESLLPSAPSNVALITNQAALQTRRGQHRKAEPLLRCALELIRSNGDRLKIANVLNQLAANLWAQERADDAFAPAAEALAILNRLGVDGREKAVTLSTLASILHAQGKHADARLFWQQCLATYLKVSGPNSTDAASAYNGLGAALEGEGRHAESLAAHQRALSIVLDTVGPDHRFTAVCYNNVALGLGSLGRYAEAQPLHEKALAIRRKEFGDDSADAASDYIALGHNLDNQGKRDQARRMLNKAVSIYSKLGDALNVAIARNALAASSVRAGDEESAHPLREQVLADFRKRLGDLHPMTAIAVNNLAMNLQHRGRTAEALPVFRKAVDAFQTIRGEDHPETASAHVNLALCLYLLGRRAETVRLLQANLPGMEAARYHGAGSGFDRAWATGARISPHEILAVGLASSGQPVNAFAAAEAGLARGLLDDLSSSGGEDGGRVGDLRASLQRLDLRLSPLLQRGDLSAAELALRDELSGQRRATLGKLLRLASDASARQVLPLSRIQKAIPDDGALVLWIDVDYVNEHWACVVRRQGKPHWLRLSGSGKGGAWTKADRLVGALLPAVSDPSSAKAHRDKALAAARKQRVEPLLPLLKATGDLPAVKRLFVVAAAQMASAPVELLAPEYRVAYVPSGSVLARLAEGHRPLEASSLLAVGDPAFDPPAAPTAEPPARGVLLTRVQPGGGADWARLRAGDVLLSIGPAVLESAEDLPAALKRLPCAVTYWREGRTLRADVRATALGANYDPRSAPAALRWWRQKRALTARAAAGHRALPGTRAEVEAIVALVGPRRSTMLLGSEASEQRLDELARQKKLKGYRVLHFATHADVDPDRPDRSALILAQDGLPDPLEQARSRGKTYDGRLTVAVIRADPSAGGWALDADLVVLSACDTGMGRQAGGDGLLGFAHAFLSRGARSVVLSRWPIDDLATSLLMVRFYQNLLGKRDGLKKPMGRAAALQEAKDWLRKLSAKEAQSATGSLPHAERASVPKPWGGAWTFGLMRASPSRGKMVPAPEGKGKPYEHPYYWAAFTLIGDPD